jgi:hypothetical protein
VAIRYPIKKVTDKFGSKYIIWGQIMTIGKERKEAVRGLAQKNYISSRVIYLGVLTRKPLEEREFQFVYLWSLLSSTVI